MTAIVLMLGLAYDARSFYMALKGSYIKQTKMYHFNRHNLIFSMLGLISLLFLWTSWTLSDKLRKLREKQEHWSGNFKWGFIHKTLWRLKIFLLAFGVTICLKIKQKEDSTLWDIAEDQFLTVQWLMQFQLLWYMDKFVKVISDYQLYNVRQKF